MGIEKGRDYDPDPAAKRQADQLEIQRIAREASDKAAAIRAEADRLAKLDKLADETLPEE